VQAAPLSGCAANAVRNTPCRKLPAALPVCALLVFSAAGCGMTEDEERASDRYTYVTLADPALEAWCLEHCDANGDGRISRYEAHLVTEIDAPGLGIVRTDGLREFKELRRITLSDNDLAEFDARPFGELVRLDVGGNPNLSLIQTDRLRRLESLVCDDCAVGMLDLRDNILLNELSCQRTQLRTLDVTTCSPMMRLVDARGAQRLDLIYKGITQRIAVLQADGHTQIVER